MRGLMWFSNDLRVHDNEALLRAAKDNPDGVLAIYVLTPETWQYHQAAPVKIDFILRQLKVLQEDLHKLNIPLQVHTVPKYQDCAELVVGLCEQYKIQNVYFTLQYEIDERHRDEAVQRELLKRRIELHTFHGDVLIPPGMILSAMGEPLKVFTAFKKKWLGFWQDFVDAKVVPVPSVLKHSFAKSNTVPDKVTGFECTISADLWPVGDAFALKRLKKFVADDVLHYKRNRDFPVLAGTSQLSPYFAQGVLSPRQAMSILMEHFDEPNLLKLLRKKDIEAWVNEFIWREFYKHIIFLFPKVCCYQTLRDQYQHWPWHQDQKLFRAWCEGRTGFPIIDAAMRQLNQTGWMHNRLRMNVAMFLSKLLLVDWHLGETYFSQHLVDGDLAANNGGWQWCAGTGMDAAPYFRIFNPLLQSEKFDPNGDFIRKYCPELKDFDKKAIHDPHGRNKSLALKVGYPEPIIDYNMARKEALVALKGLKKN